MSDSNKYTGEGQALVVREKCKQLKSFTSSYSWEFADPTEYSIFSKINYENSIIGKRTLSAVTSPYNNPNSATWSELSSDGLLNFYANYYIDFDDDELIVVKITGIYKKCNYSSREIDYLVPTTTNAATRELVKKKSGSSEEFHKLLESDPELNKSYLNLKAKLTK